MFQERTKLRYSATTPFHSLLRRPNDVRQSSASILFSPLSFYRLLSRENPPFCILHFLSTVAKQRVRSPLSSPTIPLQRTRHRDNTTNMSRRPGNLNLNNGHLSPNRANFYMDLPSPRIGDVPPALSPLGTVSGNMRRRFGQLLTLIRRVRIAIKSAGETIGRGIKERKAHEQNTTP